MNLVNNAGRCGDKIQVILSLQTLLDDLQMEKSKESAAETKSKGYRCLRLIEKGSIVELQLLQCIPKIPVLGTICRVKAAVNHRIYLLVSWQSFLAWAIVIGNGITYTGISYILNAGRNISNHSSGQLLTWNKLSGTKCTYFHYLFFHSGSHHMDLRALFYGTVK